MRIRSGRIFLSFFLVLSALTPSDVLFAEENAVDISADQVEYDQNTKMAYATGKVVIVKDDVRLTADKVRYNQQSKDLFADGNVRFTKSGQEWIGESLYYNFETGALTVGESRSKQGRWYVYNDSIKDSGTNRYEAVSGYITSCEYPEPHWRIRYTRLLIYPNEKVVGYNAVMYAGPVPLFYWPYFQRSLKDDTMPLSVVPGNSSRFGPYLYLSYEWGLSEEIKVTPHLDLRTERGIGGGLDFDYDFGRAGKGVLKGYYASDGDPKDQEDTLLNKAGATVYDEEFDTNRYRVRGDYKTDFTDALQFMVTAEKLSDPDVLEDYFEREFRDQIQPDAFADLTYSGEHYTAGILTRPNLNEFFTKTERLPDAQLAFARTPLGQSGFFYESESSVAELHREFSEAFNGPLPMPKDYNTVRGDTFHQLVYPKLLFGWLSVVPRVGGRATYYSRMAKAGNDDTLRGVFSAGSEVSFKLSKVYQAESEKLDIHDLRHVITPSLNYAYVTRTRSDSPSSLFQFDTIDAFDPLSAAVPSVKKYRPRSETTRFNPVDFPAFNAIDAIDYENVFRTGIRNQLQTKREGRPYDLLDFFVFSDLHTDPRKDQDTELISDLEVRPTKWMAIDVESRYSFDEDNLIDLNSELRLLSRDKWSFGVGQRYLRGDSHQVVTDFHYALNENWAFKVVERIDAGDGALEEQEYTVFRDLHCWTASFSFRYRSEEVGQDEIQFWVVLSLKAFPKLHTAIGK